ncbi:MAG: N-acetyltransferase family protein [Actinomycetota bacterium]|nr:N-acetyltransferase family protein [Actinomycetota bacterium]
MIRRATEADAGAILGIYAPVVRDSVATFEIEPPPEEEMRRRIAGTVSPYVWLVFERAGDVVGYAYAAPYHPRPAYAWSCEVSVYVAAAGRGGGVGRALLDELLARSRDAGFVNATARIALPNDASVRLFESRGFERIGLARGIGYKLGRWVDVGEWQKELGPRPPEPDPPGATLER